MIKNQVKTVLLLGSLTGLLIAVGLYFANIYLALVFAVLMNVGAYFFSDKIVLKMYRAKEASVAKYPRLYQIIGEVSEKAEVPVPNIYIIPTKSSNAFATGRNPKNAVVAVTKGILELLSERELKGVIAHEIAHVKNRDILISTVAATVAGAISMIAFMARWGAIFGGFGRNKNNILELLALAIVTPLVATVIRLAISRSREYLADESGAKYLKQYKGLSSALRKLEAQSKRKPMRLGSNASAHLFIVNPFSAKKIMKLFSTHPSVEKRISKLKKLNFKD